MEKEQKKILIADDDEILLKLLPEEFERQDGAEILIAKDGKETLALALKEHPDLILLDILMPGMQGIDVLEVLRQDEWGKNAKIFILTQLADVEKMAEAAARRADGYIVKSDRTIAEICEEALKQLKG